MTRDPAIDPRPMDTWETHEGRIVIVGAILGVNKRGKIEPFAFFDLAGQRYAYTPYAWRRLLKGAQLVYTPEQFLRDQGADVPPYQGLPK